MRPTIPIAALVLAALAGLAASDTPRGVEARQGSQTPAPPVAPWQVGHCYRIFFLTDTPPYILKIQDVAGDWARVTEDPTSPRVPGARPSAPIWLNTRIVFAVQEWPCSDR